jgi:hypothetical protein
LLDCTGWRQPLIWGIFPIWTQSLDVSKITWKMRKTLKKKIKIFRSFSHFFPLIFETSNGYMFQTEKNYKIWS